MAERAKEIGEYAWLSIYKQLLPKYLKNLILSKPINQVPKDPDRILLLGTRVDDRADSKETTLLLHKMARENGLENPEMIWESRCEYFAEQFFGISQEETGKQISVPAMVLRGLYCRYNVTRWYGTMRMDEPHLLTAFPYKFSTGERPNVLLNTLCQRYNVKQIVYPEDPRFLTIGN